MARADIPSEIIADYDGVNRGWRIWVPLSYIEELSPYSRAKMLGPMPSYDDLCKTGVNLGRKVADIIASPGRIQRSVQRQIKKNNRKRFGF